MDAMLIAAKIALATNGGNETVIGLSVAISGSTVAYTAIQTTIAILYFGGVWTSDAAASGGVSMSVFAKQHVEQ